MNEVSTKHFAVFGGGCFWCTEAAFGMVRGVLNVVPGYAGGAMPNPTYERVCGGDTGHAEVVRVEYDPAVIKYSDLVEAFFGMHDPTTLNKQGNDVGTQYRSVIMYSSNEEKKIANDFIAAHRADVAPDTIVTQVVPLEKFYEAEAYHHNYFKNNPDKAYCQLVISPKLVKFKKHLATLLK